jgi:DNA invertase Pin-like site-specific DNA recombinase
MKTIGYARVSTRDQDLTGQIDALRAAGACAIYARRSAARVRIGRSSLSL